MSFIGARTIYTVLIAFAVTLTLPISAYFLFSRLLAPRVTRDNAGIVLDQFQAELDSGQSIIHDPITAANVADRAYREKMHGIAVDGWDNPLRILAVVQGNNCTLTVLSAGPDGAFGTGDDVSAERSFDLSPRKVNSP
jgi:hypothetical protein